MHDRESDMLASALITMRASAKGIGRAGLVVHSDNGPAMKGQTLPARTQRRPTAPSALDRVRQAAGRDRKAKFTALLQDITIDCLRDAYLAPERQAAPGVVRGPARAQPAHCAGCAGDGNAAQESELVLDADIRGIFDATTDGW